MSWYIRSFFGFTFLNILYFLKYSCINIFHRRSLYTFYHKKKSHEFVVYNWRATAYTMLEADRFSFRFGMIISPSLSLTWQLVFYTLCLNRCFGKKGQPVSSLFHIPTGFAHNAGHAVGLRGFSTDRETVYQNCLPGRKTWRHGDPHAQNYAVCGDDLARINTIYHFYAPG